MKQLGVLLHSVSLLREQLNHTLNIFCSLEANIMYRLEDHSLPLHMS